LGFATLASSRTPAKPVRAWSAAGSGCAIRSSRECASAGALATTKTPLFQTMIARGNCQAMRRSSEVSCAFGATAFMQRK
jgi:hypothetical protein